MTAEFDPVIYARDELVPLLEQLSSLTESSEQPAQHQYFKTLLAQLKGASDDGQVVEAFLHLSAAAFLGFEYKPEVADVLDQLLEKAQHLSEALSVAGDSKH